MFSDDARRAVDEKAQQLKAIGHLSALIGGFSMVVLAEINIPVDLDPALLTIFGCSAALVVALMLVSMLSCTLILVAILRYDCVKREVPFQEFWSKRCQSDFNRSFRLFSYGVPVFMFILVLVGWIIFWGHEAWYYASSLISVIGLFTMLVWFSQMDRKWFGFLMAADAKLYNPDA